MMNYNSEEYNQQQYSDSENLNNRINIYSYNTNKINWYKWIFERIPFKSNFKILELACGNGNLWKTNLHSINKSLRIILSDLNEGMLFDCKFALSDILDLFSFIRIDIQNIPFTDNNFDIVIANHVLYHIPNIDKGLKEIYRVLKNNGCFLSTTIGLKDNKELKKIFHAYNNKIPFYPDKAAKIFGLENGKKILSKYFKKIEKFEYENSLEIPEPQSIINYASSITGINNVIADFNDFSKYIENLFIKKKIIRINKYTGLFRSWK